MTDNTTDTAAVLEVAAKDTNGQTADAAEWLKINDAAYLMGKSPRSIRRWAEAGVVVGRKVGGDWEVRADTLPRERRPPMQAAQHLQTDAAAVAVKLSEQLAALSMRCGYLESEKQTAQLRLTEGREAAEQAAQERERLAAEVDTLRAKNRRARRNLARVSVVLARVVFGREEEAA